jgi:hypothetical protein
MKRWWRVFSSGPFPWQPATEWSMRQVAPGLFAYVYREAR